ncbi:MAG TPA: DUF2231 domain-containing protein [Anaeromyxobacter sp.]|nr:DUF2231 domain-containing protein [Anaeromyxobacter sp.]
MPDLPLHAAIVHVPLGLSFIVPLVAIGTWIAVRRGRLPRSAFAILVGLQLALAGSGFAAMAAGDRDQKRVEKVVGKRVVHDHEERGEAFVWTASAVAALAIALLLLPARALSIAAALTVAGTLAVAALAFRTGEAGGEIVYRHGGAAVYAERAPGVFPAGPGAEEAARR